MIAEGGFEDLGVHLHLNVRRVRLQVTGAAQQQKLTLKQELLIVGPQDEMVEIGRVCSALRPEGARLRERLN